MMNLLFATIAFIERFIAFSIFSPGFTVHGGMENGAWSALLSLIALALIAATLAVCGLLARAEEQEHSSIQNADKMPSRRGSDAHTAQIAGTSAGRRQRFNELVEGA